MMKGIQRLDIRILLAIEGDSPACLSLVDAMERFKSRDLPSG